MLNGPYTSPPRARCVSHEFPTSGRAHTFGPLVHFLLAKTSKTTNPYAPPALCVGRLEDQSKRATADRVTVEWRVVQLEMQGPLARRDILHEKSCASQQG